MDRIIDLLIVIFFALMVIFAFVQVLLRYVFSYPAPWTEELSRYFMIWLILLGSGVGVRLENHIKIDVLERKLPQKTRILIDFLGLITCVLFFVFSVKYIIFLGKSGDTSITTGMPIAIPASAMILGGFLMSFYYCLNLYKKIFSA